MKHGLVWLNFGLAGIFALLMVIKLFFLPMTIESNIAQDTGIEIVQSSSILTGIVLGFIIVGIYGILGYALKIHHVSAFRIICTLHILLSLITFIGATLRISSLFLLLAMLCSSGIASSRDTHALR